MNILSRLSIVLFLFISVHSLAQVVGGREPGEMMPHAEEPYQLTGGNYSGSVNYFNGTYQGNYPLGSVSTQGGLSFGLSLSYNSNLMGGSNFQISSGIPYGEGWNLSVPSISVESRDYQKYSRAFLDTKVGQYDPTTNPLTIDLNEHEGDLFWHSINVNIPGKLNCKAVFKYTDTNDRKVFVPQNFEKYAEIILEYDRWRVTLEDGSVYRFTMIQEGVRSAANKRGAVKYNDSETLIETKLKDQITPKVEILRWYCTEISNPNLPNQKIGLKYERYGKFDYFQEFRQDGIYDRYKILYGPMPDLFVYKDIILKEVIAYDPFSTGDKLVLEYKTNDAAGSQDMLLVGDPGVKRKDSLYNYKTVYLRGTHNSADYIGASDVQSDFTDWKRYLHAAHNDVQTSSPNPSKKVGNLWSSLNATNPYKEWDNISKWQFNRQAVSGNFIAFDHGYLESERLTASDKLIPGETYELRTSIRSTGRFLNIDINLATGKYDYIAPPTKTALAPIQTVNADLIEGTSGTGGPTFDGNAEESIFSTFSSALKWNTYGDKTALNDKRYVETSNFFTMQNLPENYDGFLIQIGPANSDNIYNMHELGVKGATVMDRNAFESYDKANSIGYQRAHFANISGNFGLGMPWYMARTMYKDIGSSSIGPTSSDYTFWFNTNRPNPGSGPSYHWDNDPTLAKHAWLDGVELIRYSKNPFMLSSVKKYKASGEFDLNTMPLESQLDFEYEVVVADAMDNRFYSLGNNLVFENGSPTLPSNADKKKNYFLLKAIKNIPTDPAGSALSINTTITPTTHFSYSPERVTTYDSLNYSLVPFYLLTKVTNALGNERQIKYYPFTADTTRSDIKYPLTYYNWLHRSKTKGTEEAVQVLFRVDKVKERINNSDFREWDYEYDMLNAYSTSQSMNPINASGVFNHKSAAYIANSGFNSTKVYEPKDLGGNRNYSIYTHFSGGSYGGKIKSIEKFNHDNSRVEKKEFFYEASLAYEGGFLRDANEHNKFPFDYVDYFLENRTTTINNTAFFAEYDDGDIELTASRYNEFKSMDQAYSSQISASFQNSYFIKKVKDKTTIYDSDGCYSSGSATSNPNGVSGGLGNIYAQGYTNTTSLDSQIEADIYTAIENAEDYSSILEIITDNAPLTDDLIIEILDDSRFHEGLGISDENEELGESLDGFLSLQENLSNTVLIHLLTNENLRNAGVFEFYEQVYKPDLSEAVYLAMVENSDAMSSARFQIALAQHNNHSDTVLIVFLETTPNHSHAMIEAVMLSQIDLSESVQLALLSSSLNVSGQRIETILLNQLTYPSEAVLNELITLGSTSFPNNVMQVLQASETALPTTTANIVNAKAADFNPEDIDQLNYLQSHAPSSIAQCYNNLPTAQELSLVNVTEYEYYDANYDGLSSSKGYLDLFGSDNNQVYLKHEPSWQLYSTKSYSENYPNAFKENRNYYYYDLKNRYDRYDIEYPDTVIWDSFNKELFSFDSTGFVGLNPTDVGISLVDIWSAAGSIFPVLNPDGMDRSIRYGIRNIPYQTTTLSQNGTAGDAIKQSNYFIYDSRWGPEIIDYYSTSTFRTQEQSICPYDTSSAAGNSCLFVPYDENNVILTRISFGNYDTTFLHVPTNHFVFVITVGNSTTYFSQDLSCIRSFGLDTAIVYNPSIPPIITNPGTPNPSTQAPIWDLNQAMLLHTIIKQIDTINIGTSIQFTGYTANHSLMFGNTDLMHFKNNGTTGSYTKDYFEPIIPYEHLETQKILSRNIFTLPTLVEDAKGVQTKFIFDSLKLIKRVDTICKRNMPSLFSVGNVNRPTKIIVGVGRQDSIVTQYEYYPDLSLRSTLDVDYNVRVSYAYDGYGRIREERRDNELINRYNYHYWDNDFTKTFSDRTEDNYVETIHFPNDSNQAAIISRLYKDPVGREFQTINGELANGVNSSQVNTAQFSGRSQFDSRNRIIKQYKSFGFDQGGLLFDLTPREKADPTNLLTYPDTASSFAYEQNWEGRILASAKVGESLGTARNVTNQYNFMNSYCFACELSLSNLEISLLMPEGLSSNYIFNKKSTTDEDGKTSDIFTNALGQTVVTRQFVNGESVVTMSAYDKQGNLTTVINPSNQRSDYRFNLLGWLYEQETTDGGVTRFRYNQSGQVTMKQDEKARAGRQYNPENNYDTIRVYPYVSIFSYDDYGRLREKGEAYVRNLTGFLGSPYGQSSFGVRPSAPGTTPDIWTSYQFSNLSTYSWTDKAKFTSNNASPTSSAYSFNSADPTIFTPTDPIVYYPTTIYSLVIDPLHFVSNVFLSQKIIFEQPTIGDLDISLALNSSLTTSLMNRTDTFPRRVDRILVYNEFAKGQFSLSNSSRVLEATLFDYSKYGEMTSMVKKFNQHGITSTTIPIFLSKQNYSGFNNDGVWSTHNIDILADGSVDMQYHRTIDARGRIQEIYANYTDEKAGGNKIVSYDYDDVFGRVIAKNSFYKHGGVHTSTDTTNYDYDLRDRLISTDGTWLDYNLYYDNNQASNSGHTPDGDLNYNGNINGIKAQYNLLHASNYSTGNIFDAPTLYNYSYDDMNRLTNADAAVGDFLVGTNPLHNSYKFGDVNFGYDKVGNLDSLQRWIDTANNQQHWNYNYMGYTNRLASVIGTNTPHRNYTYDVAGNLTSDDSREISHIAYTDENLPIKIRKNDINSGGTPIPVFTDYYYGSSGNRIYKNNDDYEGNLPFSVYDAVYYLRDASGQSIAEFTNSSGFWNFYVNGLSREAKIGPHFNDQPNNNATGHSANKTHDKIDFYTNDHLGNTRVVYRAEYNTSNSQVEYELKGAYDYFPYGKILRKYTNGSGDERYLTTGHERDHETISENTSGTGLDNRGARFYDSDVARFLSLDPAATKFPSWSAYNYVMGNPIRLVDLDGREPTQANSVGLSGFLSMVRREGVGSVTDLFLFYGGIGPIRKMSMSIVETPIDPNYERYVYSENVGWIDMKHFAGMGTYSNIFGAESALNKGEADERSQQGGGNASAWTYEDLKSNALGIYFSSVYLESEAAEGKSFEENLNAFLSGMGVVENPFNGSPNGGSLPDTHDCPVADGCGDSYNPTYNTKSNRTGMSGDFYNWLDNNRTNMDNLMDQQH